MIGDQTNGNIIQCIGLVSLVAHLADSVTDRFHSINIKYGIYILHHNSKTFQSHTGIDILLL